MKQSTRLMSYAAGTERVWLELGPQQVLLLSELLGNYQPASKEGEGVKQALLNQFEDQQ